MKRTRIFSFLAFLLVFVMLIGCLPSCQKNDPQGDTNTADSTQVVDDNVLTLIENGASQCTIVYPYGGSKKVATVAFTLSSTLKSLYGTSVTVTDDFKSVENVDNCVEILIGGVDRTEADAVFEQITDPADWVVCVSGNKLIIAAGEDDGYDRAISYLQTNCLKEGGNTLAVSRKLACYQVLSNNIMLQNALLYTVVYPENATTRVKNAAQTLKTKLEAYAGGKSVKIASDSTAETQYEILVGDTNRKESATDEEFFYYDYLIRTVGTKIALNGGGGFAVEYAVDELVELLVHQELGTEHLVRFDTSLFNPLAYDQSSFVPSWSGTVTVPAWMTNFDEKVYAITNPSGRPMSMAHRGDTINYPENSLEGYLSAAMLGADVIEMDLLMTKDNVLVLCHDETLTRTTNVSQLKGKNGLPDSVNVCDWTYAELRQLSLLDRSGNVTEYKMPSYYEILLAMRGRCFLGIDQKIKDFNSEDVLEIETATDSVEVSIYSMFLSVSSGSAASNSYQVVINHSKSHPEMTRLAAIAEKLESYMKLSGHKIRSRGWLGGSATTDPYIESHAKYLTAYSEQGIKLIYTNNIPLMSTFIAKYQPDIK